MKMFHSTLTTFLNVLEVIKRFNLSMWFMKTRLETAFKGDNVKALIKRQIVDNWSVISLRKVRKLQHLLCFFGFQLLNNRLKMFLAPPYDQIYPHYQLVLKSNFTLAWLLRLVIPNFFKWKFLSDVRCLYLHDSK